jgi:hypothetical protein
MMLQVEKVIVKVSPLLSDTNKMSSKIITHFKDYTLNYSKVSPSAFFIDNAFYQDLSENLKVKLVKDYITNAKVNEASMFLNQMYHTFSYLFSDLDLEFQSDDKLTTMFLASLQLEYNCDYEFLPGIGIISQSIYFIYKGKLEVTLRDKEEPFLVLDDGCYYGDISYLFDLINEYVYSAKERNCQVFSIDKKHLYTILNRF